MAFLVQGCAPTSFNVYNPRRDWEGRVCPMKACSCCGETKEDAEFARDPTKSSGLRSWCRDCTSGGKAQNRAAAIAIYGGRCALCKTTEDLEFDHPDWDGAKHRRIESPDAMIRRIARTGAPLEDFRLRLLCWRCHHSPGWKERLAPEAQLRLIDGGVLGQP